MNFAVASNDAFPSILWPSAATLSIWLRLPTQKLFMYFVSSLVDALKTDVGPVGRRRSQRQQPMAPMEDGWDI